MIRINLFGQPPDHPPAPRDPPNTLPQAFPLLIHQNSQSKIGLTQQTGNSPNIGSALIGEPSLDFGVPLRGAVNNTSVSREKNRLQQRQRP